ncbi:MAG: hypothetical protein ACD_20C00109G0027 [uncultured bacterium]|nr:MAG: hypothetical protein ACD_20C00109G0027 [uncultured bacterium]HBH17964.1 hypothetical protein [Cyanobacteria bacterium UBA9579]
MVEDRQLISGKETRITQKLFMCAPYHYSIDYEINPWMKLGTESSNTYAFERWTEFTNLLTHKLGVEILTMEPQPGLPDITFTANAALIYKNRAIISRFRYKERQGEEKFFAEWFSKNGFIVEFLPEGICFEGAGDALFSGETLYAGYVPRSDKEAYPIIAEMLGIRVIPFELVDPRFYHLDTCFCPLTDGYLMYFPGAFNEFDNKIIEKEFPEEKRIPVTGEEAVKFSCNAVYIDKDIIMNHTSERLKNKLKEKGFETHEIDFSEFIKAGGSAKCLTLKLS